nr:ly6/PLAUR domain-containing protein 1 isoform X2 [Chelonoidis abingdonii]
MWLLFGAATFWGLVLAPGFGLQIQCYQCEEFQLNNDCSAPEFIVNCTVNVQDMCQKEVMEKSSGESPWSSCCRFSHPTHLEDAAEKGSVASSSRSLVLRAQRNWSYSNKAKERKWKLTGGV